MKGARVNSFLIWFLALVAMFPPFMAEEHVKIRSSTRRNLGKKYIGPCVAYNSIDKCWRCQPDWANNRKRLADCAQGFGQKTRGGKAGAFYIVTDPSDSDMVNPKPGTLRHAVIQKEPLWIIFARDMMIRLNQELIMTSHKTIDARGANVVIAGGAGFMLQNVENIIIHNLHIRNIVKGSGGMIRDSIDHYGYRGVSDGDAISIWHSHDIWIDHCSMLHTDDGLIDVVQQSTDVTISNCHFVHHDHMSNISPSLYLSVFELLQRSSVTLLFGATDKDSADKVIKVTVAFNHFGEGLTQRMPALRWGFAHVVNNDYTHWRMYAIGGADGATIISQGNRFRAPDDLNAKEVAHRNQYGQGAPESVWKHWTWRSEGDLLLNGAKFTQSGSADWIQYFKGYPLIRPAPATQVGLLTKFAGSLPCKVGKPC